MGCRRWTEDINLRVVDVKVWMKTVISGSRSAVYSRKRIGPRTDPCGTPHVMRAGVDDNWSEYVGVGQPISFSATGVPLHQAGMSVLQWLVHSDQY